MGSCATNSKRPKEKGNSDPRPKKQCVVAKASHRTEDESPATVVFAIPELLEMILSHGHGRNPLPTILFALQRVNRAFATTIPQTPSLRRIMSLDHCKSTLRSPIKWFLVQIGIRIRSECSGSDSVGRAVDTYTPSTPFYGVEGGGVWGLPSTWTAEKNATWRAVKVFPRIGSRARSVRLIIGSEHLWTDYPKPLTPPIKVEESSRVFVPEEDPLLGEVYDWFRDVVLEGFEKQRGKTILEGEERVRKRVAKVLKELEWNMQ